MSVPGVTWSGRSCQCQVRTGSAWPAALDLRRRRRGRGVGLGRLRGHDRGDVVDRGAACGRHDAAHGHGPVAVALDGAGVAGDLRVRLGTTPTIADDVEQWWISEADDLVDLVGQDDVVDFRAAGILDVDRVEDLVARLDGVRTVDVGDRQGPAAATGTYAPSIDDRNSAGPTAAARRLRNDVRDEVRPNIAMPPPRPMGAPLYRHPTFVSGQEKADDPCGPSAVQVRSG